MTELVVEVQMAELVVEVQMTLNRSTEQRHSSIGKIVQRLCLWHIAALCKSCSCAV